jgi:hypothetical protein
MSKLGKYQVRIPDAPVKPASVPVRVIREAVVAARNARTSRLTELVRDKAPDAKARGSGVRQK